MPETRGKRLLMVVHSVFPATGGAEIQAATLARRLRQRNWNVRFVALYSADTVGVEFEGTPVTRLRVPVFPGLAGALLMLRMAWLLWRERRRYDVVHVHIMKSLAFVAAVVAPMLGKRVVMKASGIDELNWGLLAEQHRNRPFWRLMNWGCRRADHVAAISGRIQRRLFAFGYDAARVVYLPNGVEIEKFARGLERSAQRQTLGLKGERIAVYVGRFEAPKGLFDLLTAWIDVRQQLPQALLVMVGYGTLEPALAAIVRSHPALQGGVYFAGKQTDVAPYLAAADVYVGASREEGLSNTMLEAMAAGLPVVSTAVSGAEDMVEDGVTGYLAPIGDAEQLAAALLRTLSDVEHARRMGARAAALARERFAIERVVERYEELYTGKPAANPAPALAVRA